MAAIDETATPPKAGFSPAETTLREKDAQGIDFVVVEPITWRGSFDGDHVQVTTSDRFTTDLASVPRFLTWVVPRYGQYTKAAIIHDYLCQQEPGPVDRGETYPAPYGPIELRDRSDADAVFRKMLAYVEVPWARQWLMWSAVTWATVITAVRTTITKPERAPATWRPDVKPALFLAVVVVAVVIADILLFNVSWPLWVSMVVVAVVSFVVLAEALMVAGCMALHRWRDRGLLYTWCALFTCLSGGLLLTGGLVALMLGLYLLVEGFPKYPGIVKFLTRRRDSEARQQRIGATAQQVMEARQSAATR